MTRFVLAAGLIALALTGCGRSKNSSENAAPDSGAPPAAQPSTEPDNRPLIVAFGDSLTAGYGADPSDSYPDVLQKLLEERGYRYRVINAGESGDTTADAVARLEGVAALKPEIVIVEFGGNDGLRGLPIRKAQENLDRVIATFQSAGAKVVLAGITLPPNYGSEYVQSIGRMYKALSAQYKVVEIPFVLQGIWDQPGMMQQDGIHPTAPGYHLMAETIFRAAQPLLTSKK